MSGAELMLLGAVAGGAMDKQNPMRGAILGGAMGGVGAGMMGGAGGLVTPPSTVMSGAGLNLVPTTGAGIGELAASRLATRGAQSAVSGGLFESLANANNPFGNQIMQSVLNPQQPNQQVVSGGVTKGTTPQFFSAGNNTGVNSNEEQIDEDELLLRLIASRSKNPKGLISISGGNNQNAMVV